MDLVCACNGLLPHVRRGRSRFMDLVCACPVSSPLSVQEMAFSCTRWECSRWTSPLPVKEKAISWTWCALAGGFPKRPGTPPEVPGELPKPKHAIIVNNCTTKVMVFGTRSKLYISRCFPVLLQKRRHQKVHSGPDINACQRWRHRAKNILSA